AASTETEVRRARRTSEKAYLMDVAGVARGAPRVLPDRWRRFREAAPVSQPTVPRSLTMESHNERKPNEPQTPNEPPAPQKKRFHLEKIEERFRIVKLEERIVPSAGGGSYNTYAGGGHSHNAYSIWGY